MKKALSTLLVFAMTTSMFATAKAVENPPITVDIAINQEVVNGKDTLGVDWNITANEADIKLRGSSGLRLAYDLDVLELVDEETATQTFNLSNTLVEEYDVATNGVYPSAYLTTYLSQSDDGKTGYLVVEVGHPSRTYTCEQALEATLSSMRFAYQSGKSAFDLTNDAIRIMSTSELEQFYQSASLNIVVVDNSDDMNNITYSYNGRTIGGIEDLDELNAPSISIPVSPTILTETLADGEINISYSQTLIASSSDVIWSLIGNLPTGLSLNGNIISGIPTTSGESNFSIKATNDFGSQTKAFSITINDEKVNGVDKLVKLSNLETSYNGEIQTPTITTDLILNTDYTIEYKVKDSGNLQDGKPIDSGVYEVIITGMGEYENTFTTEFVINKLDSNMSSSTITATYGDSITLSTTIEPVRSTYSLTSVPENTVYFYYGEEQLGFVENVSQQGEIVSIQYDTSDKKLEIGENVITVYYGGSLNLNSNKVDAITVNLEQKELSLDMVSTISNQDYTGFEIKPNIEIIDGKQLVLNEDYIISYSDNINAGTANVIITGIGYYDGAITKSFIINKVDFNGKTEVSTVVKYGTEASFDLSLWTEINGVELKDLYVIDNDSIILNSYVILEDTQLKYAVKDDINNVSKTAIITLQAINAINYNDFELSIIIRVTDKEVPVITIENISKVYDGIEILSSDINGLAINNGIDVEGTFTFVEDVQIKDVLSSGRYEIVFTPNDIDKFEIINTTMRVDIEKAIVTIKADDKTAYTNANEPTYTYSITGLVDSDELISNPTNVYGVNVDMSKNGTYAIKISQDAKSDENYSIVYEDGILVISTKSTSSGSNSSGSSSSGSTSTDTETDVETDVETDEETTTPKVENMLDVSPSAWYYDAVSFVLEQGLFAGATENEFRPEEKMSRAMLWTVLYRYNGGTGVTTGTNWYNESQKWAVLTGISDGTNPNDDMTREQLATILYRFEKAETPSNFSINSFNDASNTSSWAVDAMNWAVNEGLIQGDLNGSLNPTNTATRAEVATILMRYISK